MKREEDMSTRWIAIVVLVTVLVFPALSTADESTAQKILGEWVIVPSNWVASGTIVFYDNGRYKSNEKRTDGIGVGREGEYILDLSADPVRIDLCLGECGKPGSEWTTLFGILRFHDDGTLEIRTSPDSNYPKKFSKKQDDYTMMLTRGKH
jgi:hypothetical protein